MNTHKKQTSIQRKYQTRQNQIQSFLNMKTLQQMESNITSKGISNQSLTLLIRNWLEQLDLKHFPSSNDKLHNYKFKFQLRKILPLPKKLLEILISYICQIKFPFLIEDLLPEKKAQKNMLLKQIYTEQFYQGKWKKQFYFEFTMIFITKITSHFFSQYFGQLEINQNLQSQIFIIMYKIFLGNEIGSKYYFLVSKKYIQKILTKNIKSKQIASELNKKKDSMITLYKPSTKYISQVMHSGSYGGTKHKILYNNNNIPSNNNELSPSNIKRRLFRNKISFIKNQTPPQKTNLQIFNQQLKKNLYVDPLPLIQPKKIDINQFVREKQRKQFVKQFLNNSNSLNYGRKCQTGEAFQFEIKNAVTKLRSNKISSSMEIQMTKNNHSQSQDNLNFTSSLGKFVSSSIRTQNWKQPNIASNVNSFNKKSTSSEFKQSKQFFKQCISFNKKSSHNPKYYCLTTTSNCNNKNQLIEQKHQNSSFIQKQKQKQSRLKPSTKNRQNNTKLTYEDWKKLCENIKLHTKTSKLYEKQNINSISKSYQSKSSYTPGQNNSLHQFSYEKVSIPEKVQKNPIITANNNVHSKNITLNKKNSMIVPFNSVDVNANTKESIVRLKTQCLTTSSHQKHMTNYLKASQQQQNQKTNNHNRMISLQSIGQNITSQNIYSKLGAYTSTAVQETFLNKPILKVKSVLSSKRHTQQDENNPTNYQNGQFKQSDKQIKKLKSQLKLSKICKLKLKKLEFMTECKQRDMKMNLENDSQRMSMY